MSIARHVNLSAAIGEVKYGTYQNREHLVVPVVALQVGVLHAVNAEHPELVTQECLATCPASWNGRPILLGHPTTTDGRQISANDPRVLEDRSLGTIFNSRLKGPRLLMDAWIDPVKAERIGAGMMLGRIVAGDVIEVSIGAFVVLSNTIGVFQGKPFSGAWSTVMPDHLAFLPNGVGACSVAMGCGTRAAVGSIPDAYALGLASRSGVQRNADHRHSPPDTGVEQSSEDEQIRKMNEFRTRCYEFSAANHVPQKDKRVELSIPDGYQAALDRMKANR